MQLSIATIGIFVGLLNEGVKYIMNNFIQKDMTKWIPVFSVVFGFILGVVGYFMPGVDMGSNLIEAMFVGITAGSSSTTVHQIYKQFSKDAESKKQEETKEEEKQEEQE